MCNYNEEEDVAPCIDPDTLRDSLIDDAMFCESLEEAHELQEEHPWLARYLPEEWRK
jgi:hypothetical protein